ncbi:unnamed protein product [Rotaria magnacalcarata]|uniref:TIR domain-containing protein n=4 Tax=Rotaria magnacalcarata TaxID=392030 RepID=A0A819JSN3_9BILA|nr:unnamed protein product [Rotaria magnacalcarata]CAF2148504.1 unnamed protein product [Rotaria magnacalcarata]CAF3937866.1 unnamed protein product [Rotaria magnacalcarata]
MIVKVAHLIAIKEDSIRDKLTSSDIHVMFTDFLIGLERMGKSGMTTDMFLDAVEDIVHAVLLIVPHKLLDTKVVTHPLLHFIRQMLITLIDNHFTSRLSLNIQERNILLNINFIFVRAAEQATVVNTENDKKAKKDLLAIQEFLYHARELLDFAVLNGIAPSDDSSVCSLSILTLKLLTGHPFFYITEQHQKLIHYLVIDWLDSYDFTQAVHRLEHGEKIADIEMTILFICWEYMCSSFLIKQDCSASITSIDLIQDICDELLTRLEYALDQPPPIAPEALAHIFKRCQQLLKVHNLSSFDKHAQNIIDRLTRMLRNPLPTNADDEALIIVALKSFYNLSQNCNVRTIMRDRRLTPLFHKYKTTEVGEKQKLALAILAEIMNEQEINNNPSEITTFFLDQLKQLNPNEYISNLDSTLSGLNALMQYEQIKTKFIELGGFERLTSFVRDGNPEIQSDKQLEDAIRILRSCMFNNHEASNALKQDEKLMVRVNDLLEKSKENESATLKRVAEGFMWTVQKQEKFIEERAAQAEKKKQEKKRKAEETGVAEEEEEEEEEQKYDLMISYCWAESELAHRIFGHLSEKLGYKIWIDIEQMHGSTIEAMANAVDGAEFILMCMSESYKRSANCKSEAEYALNRKKHIVPIKMVKEYEPDGWLGFILDTRIYINFATHEFEKAIELLDNEIQLQKKKCKEDKENVEAEKKITVDSDNIIDGEKDVQNHHDQTEETFDYKHILNWNEDVVQDFLTKNKLTDLLPICNGMNGNEFCKLYGMCKSSPVVMYRSLKSELLSIHKIVLPISSYLRYMSRLADIDVDYLSLDECTYSNASEQDVTDIE